MLVPTFANFLEEKHAESHNTETRAALFIWEVFNEISADILICFEFLQQIPLVLSSRLHCILEFLDQHL